MVDILMNMEEDVTLLTCKECAIELYEELVKRGCQFLQDKIRVYKEIDRAGDVIEITKLISECKEDDAFFVFGMIDEKNLFDRTVIIDSCVEELIDLAEIPEESEIVIVQEEEEEEDTLLDFIARMLGDSDEDEYDEYEECEYHICDECLAIDEILDNEDLTFEQALREAYRCGREAALIEIQEEIEFKLFE